MSVYKISEITENNIKDKIEFGSPCLKINHYFITCESDIYVQLDNVYFKQNFQKMDGKIHTNIYLKEDFEKNFLIFDNLIINVVNDLFPLWFNKEIEMSDLLEYYIPTITDCYENNEMNEQDVTSDLFSYTSSEDEDDDDDELEENENENNNINFELSINCEIPYNYEENDLDIMIFDSSNNSIEELWNNIELMGKEGICVIKLSGLKIEKTKFHSVWELVQLKLC